MNLAELLMQPIDLEALREIALVFEKSIHDELGAIQEQYGNPHHKAEPIELPDGKFFLCADLLTEIGEGGLYHGGFANLPKERFTQVEVKPLNEVVSVLNNGN